MPPSSAPSLDHGEQVVASRDCSGSIRAKKRFRIQIDSNEVFSVPHIDDMTDEDIAVTWYDKPEYDLMKQSFIPVIKKLMKGAKVEESNSETARGLEFRTREGSLKRQQNKVKSVQTVLDEQERQLSLGLYDVEKMSELYSETAKPCLALARELGTMDEEFVKCSIAASSNSEGGGNQKKVSGLRKMIRQVRRSSLTWKSSRSVASEKSLVSTKSFTSERSLNPAAE